MDHAFVWDPSLKGDYVNFLSTFEMVTKLISKKLLVSVREFVVEVVEAVRHSMNLYVWSIGIPIFRPCLQQI